MNFDPSQFDPWRLKVIASSVSAELQSRFGRELHYPAEQVLEACEARSVVADSRTCALLMFSHPETLEVVLHGIDPYDPIEDWRRILAAKISYSDTMEIDSGTFDFHDVDSGGNTSGSGFGSDAGGDGGGGD